MFMDDRCVSNVSNDRRRRCTLTFLLGFNDKSLLLNFTLGHFFDFVKLPPSVIVKVHIY